MKKYFVVYFFAKKINLYKFHCLAINWQEAVNILNSQKVDFEYKIAGVGNGIGELDFNKFE